MAYREGSASGAGVGPMAGVIMVMIGLVVVVAVMQFAPTIGGAIEEAQPALDPASPWNSTYNTELPLASTMYTTNMGMISLLVTIIIWFGVLIREYQPAENLPHPRLSHPYLIRICEGLRGLSCLSQRDRWTSNQADIPCGTG